MAARRTYTAFATAALAIPLTLAAPATADSDMANVGFGRLFYDGEIVRTVATPTSQPDRGVDAIYAFADGVDGQLSVTSVAPGDADYHGGRWAVYVVDWDEMATPSLLTSDADIAAAIQAGDVSVTRMPAADFVCPVSPLN